MQLSHKFCIMHRNVIADLHFINVIVFTFERYDGTGSYIKDPVPSQEEHPFREHSAVLPHNTMMSMDWKWESLRIYFLQWESK